MEKSEIKRKVKEIVLGRPVARSGTDIIGYEHIISFLSEKNILSSEGDLVEIGTFLGGGAYMLSRHIESRFSDKKLYVIDIFDPSVDLTERNDGSSMASLYSKTLARYEGMSQREIFDDVTKSCKNLVVLEGDSQKIAIPANKLAFAFIDGNHDPEYVRSDFELVWSKISPGGAVGFHDYNHDLPQTTEAINLLIKKYEDNIKEVVEDKANHIVYLIKNSVEG